MNNLSRLRRAPQRAWQFDSGLIGRAATRASRWIGQLRGSYLWQRAMVTRARRCRRPAEVRFLVLGAARSGTTLLADYLNCHPRVLCRGEILNADYGYYGNPAAMNCQRLLLHVESFFVPRQGEIRGAKLLTYQLDELPISLPDVIERLGQPRVVVIYREQTIHQFASLKLAQHSGAWHANAPLESEPISLDPDEFVGFARRERRMWQEMLSALQTVPCHFLSYERLRDDRQLAMRGVFHFLGQSPCPVESFVVRINPERLADKVVNHADFESSGLRELSRLQLPFRTIQDVRRAA